MRKSFGHTEIIRGVSLDIPRGQRHAIIGPNGAGKTTLFNLISGRFPLTSGTIELERPADRRPERRTRSTGCGLSRSFQITAIFPRMTVFENIRCGLLWSRGYSYSFWHLLGGSGRSTRRAERLLERLNLTARRDVPAGLLSYAEQRALEVGITIAGGASVILLDEPTAGMSHTETGLCHGPDPSRHGRADALMVEHDMSVVFGLADVITRGGLRRGDRDRRPQRIRGQQGRARGLSRNVESV